MEGSSQAAVTPDGVRDGDPAVLSALVARRGPAVLAFCEAVCEPRQAPQAAAEAFARFRALVATVGDTTGMDPEVYLLGATRHAAASMARPPAEDRGMLRVLGRGATPETTAAVPMLLAARADDMLGPEDLERLSRLLERSAGSREVEAAFRRAERGYRSPPERPVSPETVALIVTAMQAAAPVAPQHAVTPAAAADADPYPDPDAVAVQIDEDVEAALIGGAEIVLPEPETEPVPEPGPVPEAEAEPAPAPTPIPGPEPELEPVVAQDLVPADDEPDPEPEPEPEPEDALPEDATAVLPAVTAAAGPRRLPRPGLPHGGGLRLPRPGRGTDVETNADHGPVYRLVLPTAAVVIAILVMLAIAGVFGGDDPTPAGLLLAPPR